MRPPARAGVLQPTVLGMDDTESTRQSWNRATRNHNAHKGDQAARLAAGEELLFPEELSLLGDLSGKRLVHLQCNAGQDSLCLARRGADVTGVDLSDEAIDFARALSARAGIPARFLRSELLSWMAQTDERFDVAFTSYGTTGWLPDLGAWARGVRRVLRPGGVLVYVEFHPLVWSLGDQDPGTLSGDDYFATAPFREPVGDYVAAAGAALGAVEVGETVQNTIPAVSYQHGLAEVLQALCAAGMRLTDVREWPHSNGARIRSGLVPLGARRYGWPEGAARIPLMFGIRATRDGA